MKNIASYISDNDLMNLKEMSWGKDDKMRVLLSILSLYHSKFNKFNNTGARMLDFIYHMTLNSSNCMLAMDVIT